MVREMVHSRQVCRVLFVLFTLVAVASAGGFRTAAAGELDCANYPINAVIHTAPIQPPPHQTEELLFGVDEITMARGDRRFVYVALVSQLPADSEGVEAWLLAFNVNGNVDLAEAGFDETVGAVAPGGLRQGSSFAYNQMIDPEEIHPETGKPQGQGAISLMIFSLLERVHIQPVGTASAIKLRIDAPADRDPQGEIVFRDRLVCGEEVFNLTTVETRSVYFGPPHAPLACMKGAKVVPVLTPFIRGDSDGNGQIQLTDGVRIHRYLFVGDPPTLECFDAADVDDSGNLNLTDGVRVYQYLFRGGDQPPPPFLECGGDATPGDVLTCSSYPCN